MRMRQHGLNRCAGAALAVALSVLLSGCHATQETAVQFPATWPGSKPLGEDAPTVSVLPIAIAGDQAIPSASSEEGGLPTAAVLSALFVKYLHANGVNAILEAPEATTAEYTLACAVLELGYGAQEEYPKERRYRAELACKLQDGQTQQIVWERSLKQRYDETEVLNFLTNLPPEPHRDDRILYRECIVPLWDAMASSVGTVVTTRRQARPLAEKPSG